MVVTVDVVVVTKAVVEWVLWLVGCGGWVFFFFSQWGWMLVASSGCVDVGFAGLRRNS